MDVGGGYTRTACVHSDWTVLQRGCVHTCVALVHNSWILRVGHGGRGSILAYIALVQIGHIA